LWTKSFLKETKILVKPAAIWFHCMSMHLSELQIGKAETYNWNNNKEERITL